MRIACFLATATFGLFACLQLNDFEQYGTRFFQLWFAAYGAVAVVSLVSAWHPLPRLLNVTGAASALVAAAVRTTAIQWDSPLLYNEANPAGNETGGLLVTAAWLAVLAWRRSG